MSFVRCCFLVHLLQSLQRLWLVETSVLAVHPVAEQLGDVVWVGHASEAVLQALFEGTLIHGAVRVLVLSLTIEQVVFEFTCILGVVVVRHLAATVHEALQEVAAVVVTVRVLKLSCA